MPPFSEAFKRHALEIAVLVLVGTASFGLGRLSLLESKRPPVTIDYFAEKAVQTAAAAESVAVSPSATESDIVASKKGKAYHYAWCPGAAAIAPENMIRFATPEDARAAGYSPAKNCKGLK